MMVRGGGRISSCALSQGAWSRGGGRGFARIDLQWNSFICHALVLSSQFCSLFSFILIKIISPNISPVLNISACAFPPQTQCLRFSIPTTPYHPIPFFYEPRSDDGSFSRKKRVGSDAAKEGLDNTQSIHIIVRVSRLRNQKKNTTDTPVFE